jgi:hypothetical protein
MKIKISGVAPYDGEYPIDFARLTNGQIRTIKRISGYTPVEYVSAGQRGDNDFLVAIAVAALERSGQHAVVNEQAFWNSEAGGIDVILDAEEEAAGDPPTISEAETPTTPSGGRSSGDSELPQVSPLRSTGTP